MAKKNFYVVGFTNIYGKLNRELKTNDYGEACQALNAYNYHSSLIYDAKTDKVLFSSNLATETLSNVNIKFKTFFSCEWSNKKWMESVAGQLA